MIDEAKLVVETKVCRICGEKEGPKPLCEFHQDVKNRDGLKTVCRACTSGRYHGWHAKRTGEEGKGRPGGGATYEVKSLRKVRTQELGLTQEEMARAIGCSKSMVSKLETGALGASRALCNEIIAYLANERRRREGRSNEDVAGGYETI